MKMTASPITALITAIFCWPLLWPGLVGAESRGTDPLISLDYVLEGIRQRYAVTDFEADFYQESVLQAMGIVDTARGHVSFRPPTDMRWHYRSPEEYILVLNAERIWLYWPDDHQVMVGRPKDYLGHMGFGEFFSDPARLLEDFDIEVTTRPEKGDVYTLKLIPHQPDPNLEQAFLRISRDTFLIDETIIYNAFGDKTRIRFSDVRFNTGLDPGLFLFEIPKGAQVLPLESE